MMVALATAKRQKIETGAATGPCCRKMAIQVVPQISTTRPYNSAFIFISSQTAKAKCGLDWAGALSASCD
ncbi:hypothetical protein D3C72_1913270 [compost metagenome]